MPYEREVAVVDLFANSAALDALEDQLRALLVLDSPAELRAWVAGCGTGEDAYACAILLHNVVAQHGRGTSIKVFATDADLQQLVVARAGIYSMALLANLKPEQQRHFRHVDGALHINTNIHQLVVFVPHEFFSDPPFFPIDLVVCRNLCTAFNLSQRAQAITRFAFALRPGGVLLLDDKPLPKNRHFQATIRRVGLYTRSAGSVPPLQQETMFVADTSVESVGLTDSIGMLVILARLPGLIFGTVLKRVMLIVQPLPRIYGGNGLLTMFFKLVDLATTYPNAAIERDLVGEFADLHDRHLLTCAERESAVEELALQREELQTLNEELLTINQEQRQTLTRLNRVNADLHNLMSSVDIGILFLDRELRVKRYTPQMQTLFHIHPSDLGLPLAHFAHQLQYDALIDDAHLLLTEIRPTEREVPHADGRWFLVKMQPYQGENDQIDGVILTFLDISKRWQAEMDLRHAHDELEQRVEARTAELVQAHAARKALMRELVQAQENERRRIARDLHDQLGQQITAALLALRAAQDRVPEDSQAVPFLEQMRGIVQSLGREIHQIASDLRPTALDDVGLSEALQTYAESWSHRTGIMVAVFVTGIERKSLLAEIETIIYRVVLEALTNIVRHAQATQVNIVLERHMDTLIVMVEDNGCGFDVESTFQRAQQGGHIGLLGMQERLAMLNGTLMIESTPGSGTTVIVRIPLDSSERQSNDEEASHFAGR
ncbi:MAG: hypothetical protein HGA19_16360 [Oscillochloris sp.]|nr:hypothetical protein [Oscillochloris sp.]